MPILIVNGFQERVAGAPLLLLTDQKTGSTFAVPSDVPDLAAAIEVALRRVREKFEKGGALCGY